EFILVNLDPKSETKYLVRVVEALFEMLYSDDLLENFQVIVGPAPNEQRGEESVVSTHQALEVIVQRGFCKEFHAFSLWFLLEVIGGGKIDQLRYYLLNMLASTVIPNIIHQVLKSKRITEALELARQISQLPSFKRAVAAYLENAPNYFEFIIDYAARVDLKGFKALLYEAKQLGNIDVQFMHNCHNHCGLSPMMPLLGVILGLQYPSDPWSAEVQLSPAKQECLDPQPLQANALSAATATTSAVANETHGQTFTVPPFFDVNNTAKPAPVVDPTKTRQYPAVTDYSCQLPVATVSPVRPPLASAKGTTGKSVKLKPTRRMGGLENVFTREQVQTWSSARVHAWNQRYINPDAFYYRFVDPTEGQANGGFHAKDHKAFMARLSEWQNNGYRIGSSWGLFSAKVPHKAGYMCSNYYRKLLETRRLTDDAYQLVNGKLVMVHKQRVSGASGPTPKLSEQWETPEVKAIEKQVDAWIQEFHPGTTGAARPSAALSAAKRPKLEHPKRGMASSASTPTPTPAQSEPTSTASPTILTADRALKRPRTNTPSDPQVVIPNHEYKERQRRLAELRAARTKPASIVSNPGVPAGRGAHSDSTPPLDPDFVPVARPRSTQIDLSRFWAGVKAPEAPIPEPIQVRIPFPIPLTWAKAIMPLGMGQGSAVAPDQYVWWEVPQMQGLTLAELARACKEHNAMHQLMDASDTILGGSNEPLADPPTIVPIDSATTVATDSAPLDFDGILVDPPWTTMYEQEYAPWHPEGTAATPLGVTVDQVRLVLANILPSLPRGMVFIWTHKALIPAVVDMMLTFGCRYVENLIWFKKAITNRPLNRPSPYFRYTKDTLLLFKRGDGFDIRHQRTADVVIDFAHPKQDWIWYDWVEPKPDAIYEMIETMLPNASYRETTGRGRLLELWSSRHVSRRSGWVYVCEPKTIYGVQAHGMEAGRRLLSLPGVASDHTAGHNPRAGARLALQWAKIRCGHQLGRVIRAGSSKPLVLDAKMESWLVPRRLQWITDLAIDPDSTDGTQLTEEVLTQAWPH
ncbi:hypothetical protein H4R34_000683, partial [Dimargaris verticillata]